MSSFQVSEGAINNPSFKVKFIFHSIDFGEIPRTVRFKIFEMIPKFSNLKILIIGPGTSGAWIPIKVRNIIISEVFK